MTHFRLLFSEPRLLRFYSDLQTEGLSVQDLDQGCPSLLYSQISPGPIRGAHDGRLRTCELFQSGLTRLGSSLFNPIYRRFSGERLPWTLSPASLSRFDQEIAQWRRTHPESPGGSEALVRAIYRWVTDRQHPTGLRMRVNEHPPERSAEEILQTTNPEGDCSEFAMVFFALLGRAGFSPAFRWVGIDRDGSEAQHLLVETEAQSESGETTRLQLDAFYDPLLNPGLPATTLGYDPLRPGHRRSTPMGLREVLGWYWNNRGLEHLERVQSSLCDSQRRRQGQEALAAFGRALEIDPQNPHIWLNRGILYSQQSNETQARRNFHRALQIDRRFAPAYYEMGNLEFDRGRYAQAALHYRMAVGLSPQDPAYRRNLILALAHAQQTQAAREQLAWFSQSDPNSEELESLITQRTQP